MRISVTTVDVVAIVGVVGIVGILGGDWVGVCSFKCCSFVLTKSGNRGEHACLLTGRPYREVSVANEQVSVVMVVCYRLCLCLCNIAIGIGLLR